MFDTGATGEVFMDKRYAQQQRIPFIPLIRPIPLQGFDGNSTGSGPVTHFVYILFAPPGHKPQLTRLFLTDISQFPIVINLPWMRNKFTTIKLKPDISTIDFEQLDEINQSFTTPEISETKLLAKLKNSGHPSSPLLAKSNNYQPPSVEEIPDEGKRDLIIEKFPTSKKRKFPGQRNQERRKAKTLKRGELELPAEELVKGKGPRRPVEGGEPSELPEEELLKEKGLYEVLEAPLEIKMIAAAPFYHVSKQKGVKLFSASLKNVEKALRPKQRTDPATKLLPKLHEFFELFSEKEANKLPPHRLYDYKIKFIKSKQPKYGPLYSMSQRELQVLKKFLDENLAKGFIRTSLSPAAAPVLFVKKPGGGLRLCVNYRALNAITIKNRYPLPLIQETLDRLAKAKYFTKLDIVAAFNKIRMAEGEEWKTVFRTRYGLFESLIMNFGLCGAPSSFQNYINDILHEYLDTFCSAYIDDILIYSKTKKEHMKHVQQILQKL